MTTDLFLDVEDDRIRAAFDALRADVEEVALDGPDAIMLRGASRRARGRLTWAAAVAAAVLVVAVVVNLSAPGRAAPFPGGPSASAPTGRETPRATASGTSAPAPIPSGAALGQEGPLPLVGEWRALLGLGQPPVGYGGLGDELTCDTTHDAERIDVINSGRSPAGEQVLFATASIDDSNTLAGQLLSCPAAGALTAVPTGQPWPSIWSGGSGRWYIAAATPRRLAVIHIEGYTGTTDQPSAQAGIEKLAAVAQERLVRYGEGPLHALPAGVAAPTGSGPSEGMTIAGSTPAPSADVFLPPSLWASEAVTEGSATIGLATTAAEPTMMPCDTDTSASGTWGISTIGRAQSRQVVGGQRVRLYSSTDAAAAALIAAVDAFKGGCSLTSGEGLSWTPGSTPHAFAVTHTANGSTESFLVGFTTMKTPGALTTIVLVDAKATPAQFAELEQLLAEAARR